MEPIRIRKAAVLGAGVMGAQIAAHLANAGFSVELFDLKSEPGAPNQIVDQAIERLKKLEPSPWPRPQYSPDCDPATTMTTLIACATAIW